MLKPLLIFSTMMMLVGCAEQPTDVHEEYRHRLAKFVSIAPTSDVALESWPQFDYSEVAPSTTISLIQLGQLNHCQLAGHIASHNNQLGKVATPSELFKYHIRFIQLVEPCLKHPKTIHLNADLKQALADARTQKVHMASVYFNNILAREPELTRMTTLSASQLGFEEQAGKVQSQEALELLAQIADNIEAENFNAIDPVELTSALSSLNNNDYVRKLLTSTRAHIALNNALTLALEDINISENICPPNRANSDTVILHNIFNMFYIKQLQPYQAHLSGDLQRLTPLLARIWQFMPDTDNPKTRVFGSIQRTSLLQQLKQASKNHVLWWQNFYKQCDIKPV
ncbi:DUF3080 family protein [Pseudoalteromonas pernae]|uniref:DUF3080 family protein n=1 Tax=Pseudoalteromonas pernae TaxID=3118054 RepID=UPI003242E4BD